MELKTIEQILEEVALSKNCDDFDLLVRRMPTMFIIKSVEEAMIEYGKQVAIQQRELCFENVKHLSIPFSNKVISTKLVVD